MSNLQFATKYVFYDSNEIEVEENEVTNDLLFDAPPAAEEKQKDKSVKNAAPRKEARLAAPPPPPAPQAIAGAGAAAAQDASAASSRRRHQVDTNVVSIRFDSLPSDREKMFAGDPPLCKHCKAALSHLSKLEKEVAEPDAKASEEDDDGHFLLLDGQQLWTCEYCGRKNAVELDEEEVPKTECRDYVLGLVGGPQNEQKADAAGETSLVVFVVDISGSMCVTTEVPGKFKLRGPPKLAAADLGGVPDDGFDYNPQVNQNVTYVSRLQAVQAAVDTQLENLAKKYPNKRVALITFNDEVTILGDGSGAPVVLAGNKLYELARLKEEGAKVAIQQAISHSRDRLSAKLFDLKEKGSTALGPALVVALSMAASSRGSSVILCTDGLANIGLGKLDNLADDEAVDHAEKWYDSMATLASEHGTVCSVISLVGADCSLENLGRLAEKTGGKVDRVDPLQLTQNFASILDNPILATDVKATFILHQALAFRNEDTDGSTIQRVIGNVTKDSELTLAFGIRSKEAAEKFRHLMKLPFQLQIHYTSLDGVRGLRIITMSQEITRDRQKAEGDARVDIMAANFAGHGARLAKQGQWSDALSSNYAHAQYLKKVARASQQEAVAVNAINSMQGISNVAARRRAEEEEEDALGADLFGAAPAPSASKPRSKKAYDGRARFDDRDYQAIQAPAQSSSMAYLSSAPAPAQAPAVKPAGSTPPAPSKKR